MCFYTIAILVAQYSRDQILSEMNRPKLSSGETDGVVNESDRHKREIKICKIGAAARKEGAEHLRVRCTLSRGAIERVRIEPGRLPPLALINGSRVVT